MSKDKNNDSSVEDKALAKRRDLLKKLTAGGSTMAAAKWSAPIVTAISVPAHAQTSFTSALVAVVTLP